MIVVVVSLFYGQNYLFRGKLFLLFSISTKILEHKVFFSSVSEEMYSEVYHSPVYYFSNDSEYHHKNSVDR